MSLLVGVPSGAVEVISLLINGYICDRFHNRVLIGAQGLIVSIVGMIVVVALPSSNSVGRLIGYYLTGSSANSFVALLSLVSTNVAGYTKKTTVAALYLIGYCTYIHESSKSLRTLTTDHHSQVLAISLDLRRSKPRMHRSISQPRLQSLSAWGWL